MFFVDTMSCSSYVNYASDYHLLGKREVAPTDSPLNRDVVIWTPHSSELLRSPSRSNLSSCMIRISMSLWQISAGFSNATGRMSSPRIQTLKDLQTARTDGVDVQR